MSFLNFIDSFLIILYEALHFFFQSSVSCLIGCLIFYMQVQESIFTDSNKLIKSIQIWLNALNELRLCHVMQKSSSFPSRVEISKVTYQTKL